MSRQEPLKIGEDAPDFTLPSADGGSVTLSALAPQKCVLYFYPKDDTPGCTLEAQDFNRLLGEFEAAGVRVLGISKDSVAKHGKFCQKHGLSITLLSDEGSEVCEAYGVWGAKQNYGRSYMGINRTTYLIDAHGRIAQVWEKVKVKGHAEAVLDAAKAI